jgi:hypothetical protein
MVYFLENLRDFSKIIFSFILTLGQDVTPFGGMTWANLLSVMGGGRINLFPLPPRPEVVSYNKSK